MLSRVVVVFVINALTMLIADMWKKGEQIEPCFNCDECYHYNGYGRENKKYDCKKYVIAKFEVRKNRARFKILKFYGLCTV